jgi:phosphate ABC transporter phosphate-binding protein
MRRTLVAMAAGIALVLAGGAVAATPASAATWTAITGSGSTWGYDALSWWRVGAATTYGMTVNYNGVGSTQGRVDFINNQVDFAMSEIPFQAHPQDGSAPENPTRAYEYVPLVAGGLSFMYNLVIGGKRVTDLRLSGEVITKIFLGRITNWNDPAIQTDNPGLVMPDEAITPVVRSDGSGTSSQFTQWMSTVFPTLWTTGATSQFPKPANGKAQNGSFGVAGYVSQAYGAGAITYVENSYAIKVGFPVAKLLNQAGYYVAPTADAVSIALLAAQSDAQGIEQLGGVYGNPDPRAYPLSGYAYMIVPTKVEGIFNAAKGATLGQFLEYSVCDGQGQAESLGYAPLPRNLVQSALTRIGDIPGSGGAPSITACANPTFSSTDPTGTTTLEQTAPMPPAADRKAGYVAQADLLESTRTLGIQLAGSLATVSAGIANAGKTLQAGMYPYLVDLGPVTLDAGGVGTIDLSGAGIVPPSTHSLYLAESDGTVRAWNTFTVTIGPPGSVSAGAGLSATLTVSGRFELVAPSTTAIDFGPVHRDGLSDVRQLGSVGVIDDRANPTGWALDLFVSAFVSTADASHTFPGAAVGFAPQATNPPAGVTVATPEAAGAATYPAVFASGASGMATGEGGAFFDSALTLRAPVDAWGGTYRSTLTLTLMSR